MASAGRDSAGERDKPQIANTRTMAGTESSAMADEPSPAIANVITCAHPMGQTPGSSIPPIANTITKAGPNK